LRLVHQSYEALPVGQTLASLAPIELVAQFSTTFVYGFVIVAPVVVCLLLIDIGLAFASRTMPQLNVFVMSMTIKCCVALMVLSVSIRLTGGLASQIFDGTFRFFEGWMH
jgi:flagellar biosynthesis protein FliR